MSETNGIYPVMPIRRHEDDCIGCLEPWDCSCECNTCKSARILWKAYQDYKKYILDPRDLEKLWKN